MKKLLSLVQAVGFLALTAQVALATLDVPQPVNVPKINIGDVISAVVGILLIISAIAAFLFLILGGLQWITSGGDKAGVEAARNKITNAVIGLIIVAAAWAIMLLLGQVTGINILGGGLKIPTFENPSTGI
jgi:hypothetical protein